MRRSLRPLTSLVFAIGCLGALRAPGADSGTMPSDLRQYAQAMNGSLIKMIQDDPNLARDAGNAAQLKLDFDQSFLMHKVDPALLEGASQPSQAVVSAGIYYVPLCAGARCPMMAAFGRDAEGKAEFVSVGQPNLTQQLRETRDRLRADSSLSPESLQPVQYNEAGANFYLAKKADGSGEVLVPQSAAEAQALEQALGRPASEKDAQGRPRFSLGEMRSLARAVREQGDAEEAQLPARSQLSDPRDIHTDKPVNRGGRTASSDESAAVLELNSTTGAATVAAATSGSGSAVEAPSASTPRETASENAEAKGIAPVPMLGEATAAVLLTAGLLLTTRLWSRRRKQS